ncbi:MAG: deoxyribonuclease IV [Candidatus Omnitrophica bacterium]|nr:deoxyribonuclease IV [Candidatus Omnitrophota bacterium]
MLLGVHVSGAGKIYEAIARAEELGCNTMQVFSRNPQRWRENQIGQEDVAEFVKRAQNSGIKPIFIHIPYLLNLASPDYVLYRASMKAYVEDMHEASLLKADYIVTHMGSHKQTSEKSGLKRLITALNRILEKTKESSVGILLENTSGSGSWLGYKFSHQKEVIDNLKQKERVGLCLDTAHAYVAGYDISTKNGLEEMLDEIDNLVGLDLVKLIHLNDTPAELGSHRDLHAHIGKGSIGMKGMERIINHPKLKKIPFILETPKDSEHADEMNLKIVRHLRA